MVQLLAVEGYDGFAVGRKVAVRIRAPARLAAVGNMTRLLRIVISVAMARAEFLMICTMSASASGIVTIMKKCSKRIVGKMLRPALLLAAQWLFFYGCSHLSAEKQAWIDCEQAASQDLVCASETSQRVINAKQDLKSEIAEALESTNSGVVAFAIDMCYLRSDRRFDSTIVELLSRDDLRIRAAACDYIDSTRLVSAVARLNSLVASGQMTALGSMLKSLKTTYNAGSRIAIEHLIENHCEQLLPRHFESALRLLHQYHNLESKSRIGKIRFHQKWQHLIVARWLKEW